MNKYQIRIDVLVKANTEEEAITKINDSIRIVPVTMIEDYDIIEILDIEEDNGDN